MNLKNCLFGPDGFTLSLRQRVLDNEKSDLGHTIQDFDYFSDSWSTILIRMEMILLQLICSRRSHFLTIYCLIQIKDTSMIQLVLRLSKLKTKNWN
ncbi:hypothetical protein Golob_026733 [Gossypium lobatum]|uniref:Uncharacterized protein n=1 Tax=Gossypium lobatum TaxID=34289 RepID=A0A7J8LW83_9ROSI|nr:hypothetical protein [Gossypium lobatum]